MHRKFIASCAAVAALAICMVVPALASATPLMTDTATAGTETAVAVGSLVQATNTTNIVFTPTSFGPTVTCTKSVLTGEVKANSTKGSEGTIKTATFTNSSGGACSDSFGGSWTVTTEIATTDWCIKSTGEDKFTLQGGACGGSAKALNFVLETGSLVCKYSRAVGTVTGKYGTTESENALVMDTSLFAGDAANSGLCPGGGNLTGSYAMETDNAGALPIFFTP